jgi:hypothetical protein
MRRLPEVMAITPVAVPEVMAITPAAVREVKALPSPRRGGARGGVRKVAAAAVAAAIPAVAGISVGDELTKAILAALKKRPMVSGEVIKETKAKASDVYQRLSLMRKSGVIETREDPSDFGKKNYVK